MSTVRDEAPHTGATEFDARLRDEDRRDSDRPGAPRPDDRFSPAEAPTVVAGLLGDTWWDFDRPLSVPGATTDAEAAGRA